ncbi:MAG: DUF861 domain-containing protein [Gammaproteobacteria bacterium]|nr:DUF861 domain-containing protein [Gammaproteobacteria bacterium]
MNVDKVTQFEFDGPADTGLVEWEAMDPADIESGEPVQRGHFYYNDEATGLMAGVWDCTPYRGKMEPYSVDEFMYVLEGSVTMELEDGSSTTISAGESFIVPKGLICRWVQTEYIRKYFVIFSSAEDEVHDNPARYGIMTPRPSDATTPIVIEDTSRIIGTVPEQHNHIYYTDVTGQFTVGMWNSTAFERPVFEFDHFDLMCILEGEATVSDGAGNNQVFKTGEACFVPLGAQYKWQCDVPVTKVYCAFTPRKAVADSSVSEQKLKVSLANC